DRAPVPGLAFPVDGHLVGPGREVAVEAVGGHVEGAAGEPAAPGPAWPVDLVEGPGPVQAGGRLRPRRGRVSHRPSPVRPPGPPGSAGAPRRPAAPRR